MAALRVPGDYVAAPLTRFDIGHDEAVSDHDGAMPGHGDMMTHRHREMTSMDITRVDDDSVAAVPYDIHTVLTDKPVPAS